MTIFSRRIPWLVPVMWVVLGILCRVTGVQAETQPTAPQTTASQITAAPAATAADAQLLAVGANVQHKLLPFLTYWYSADVDVSLAAAMQANANQAFKALRTASANLGFKTGAHWFHFNIRNTLPQARHLYLELDYPVLDDVRLMCAAGTTHWETQIGGDHFGRGRLLAVRNLVFPLEFEPHGTRSCFLRVVSTSNILLPLTLYDQNALMATAQTRNQILGVFYALTLAAFCVALGLAWVWRNSIFLWIGLNASAGILMALALDGMLAAIALPSLLSDAVPPVAMMLGCVSACIVTLRLLPRLVDWALWLYWSFCISIGLNVASVCAMAWVPIAYVHMFILILVSVNCALFVAAAIVYLRHQRGVGLIYLLSYGGPCVFVFWIATMILTASVNQVWLAYGGHLAWCLEILTLTLCGLLMVRDARRRALTESAPVSSSVGEPRGWQLLQLQTETQGLVLRLGSGALSVNELQHERQAAALSAAAIQHLLPSPETGAAAEPMQAVDLVAQFELLGQIYGPVLQQRGVTLTIRWLRGTPLRARVQPFQLRSAIALLLTHEVCARASGALELGVGLADEIHNNKLTLRLVVELPQMTDYSQRVGPLVDSATALPDAALPGCQECRMGLRVSAEGECRGLWLRYPIEVDAAVATESAIAGTVIYQHSPVSPVAVDQASAPTPRSAAVAAATPQYRVLIVEDNQINQSVISEFLKKLGIEPVIASMGGRGIELACQQDEPFDLVLMDCELPDIDGFEASAQIRAWQQERGVDLPVLALSAHSGSVYRERALAAGMREFVTKPVTFRQLRETLSRYLNKLETGHGDR